MRITQAMLCNQAIRNISQNYSDMVTRQTQVSSGKQRTSPSDDPCAASTSLYLSGQGSRLSRYAQNVEAARTLVTETELALSDINESIQSIQELVIQASTGTMSQSERESICAEINEYRDQIISSLNTSTSGGYLFGGYNTNRPPVTESGGALFYNGIDLSTMTDTEFDTLRDQTITVALSKGITMEATITALDVIGRGSDSLIGTIDQITQELIKETPDETVLDTQKENLNTHFNNVLVAISQAGGKENRLDMVGAKLEQSQLSIEDMLSEVDDVEFEETVIRYKMAEQAYNAALSVGSNMVQSTLLDYLK